MTCAFNKTSLQGAFYPQTELLEVQGKIDFEDQKADLLSKIWANPEIEIAPQFTHDSDVQKVLAAALKARQIDVELRPQLTSSTALTRLDNCRDLCTPLGTKDRFAPKELNEAIDLKQSVLVVIETTKYRAAVIRLQKEQQIAQEQLNEKLHGEELKVQQECLHTREKVAQYAQEQLSAVELKNANLMNELQHMKNELEHMQHQGKEELSHMYADFESQQARIRQTLSPEIKEEGPLLGEIAEIFAKHKILKEQASTKHSVGERDELSTNYGSEFIACCKKVLDYIESHSPVSTTLCNEFLHMYDYKDGVAVRVGGPVGQMRDTLLRQVKESSSAPCQLLQLRKQEQAANQQMQAALRQKVMGQTAAISRFQEKVFDACNKNQSECDRCVHRAQENAERDIKKNLDDFKRSSDREQSGLVSSFKQKLAGINKQFPLAPKVASL